MSIILQNPYRVLGVPVNASERDIQKHITKATRFAEVGKAVSFDTDFPFLGEVERSPQAISKASSEIDQPKDRIMKSLFWFWSNNHIDEAAIDNLKKENIEKVVEMWSKVVKDGDVSEKNYSNLANLKSLFIALSVSNGSLNKDYLNKGLTFAGRFFNHSKLESYCDEIGGKHINISSKELEDKYIDSIYKIVKPYLNKRPGITTAKFLSSFNTFSKEAQHSISQKFTADPINRIEKEIEDTSELRKEFPLEAIDYGDSLYSQTEKDLAFLTKVLGKKDVKYQMLANKLANEILQCSIDYFNKIRDIDEETEQSGKNALRVCLYAKSIVCGGQVMARVDDSYEFIQEWVDDAPERERFAKVARYFESIQGYILTAVRGLENGSGAQALQLKSEADTLMRRAKVQLDSIKHVLGVNDETYNRISSEVVAVVLALMVKYVNATSAVLGVQADSVNILRTVGGFAMDSETRSRYVENKTTLERMHTQYTQATSKSSGGCYIATMVYGDYDHPQVMVLRGFRDDFLAQYFLGRVFIEFYYQYSPQWVERMKNKGKVNQVMRGILEQVIKLIKK